MLFEDSSWHATEVFTVIIDGMQFLAPTRERLITMVKLTFPLLDDLGWESKIYNHVFYPRVYPIK